jgi:hypothetical protein
VAIVNEEFAKSYWPNQEPLGKRFHLNDARGPWIEVVGVTKTGKYIFVGETPFKFFYLPFAQNPSSEMLLLVRTSGGDPAGVAAPIRAIVQGLDANQPVYNVNTLDMFYQQRAVAVPMMVITLVTCMGLIGLVLALVGLYGLMAYSVGRRTREIGIRMAVGADRNQVLKMVIRQGLILAVTGVAIGSAATFGLARLIAAGLIGLGKLSPATFYCGTGVASGGNAGGLLCTGTASFAGRSHHRAAVRIGISLCILRATALRVGDPGECGQRPAPATRPRAETNFSCDSLLRSRRSTSSHSVSLRCSRALPISAPE